MNRLLLHWPITIAFSILFGVVMITSVVEQGLGQPTTQAPTIVVSIAPAPTTTVTKTNPPRSSPRSSDSPTSSTAQVPTVLPTPTLTSTPTPTPSPASTSTSAPRPTPHNQGHGIKNGCVVVHHWPILQPCHVVKIVIPMIQMIARHAT